MKILVIDNSAISVDDNGFYTDAFNGNFVSELQKIGNDVSFLHFSFAPWIFRYKIQAFLSAFRGYCHQGRA
jgi:hypothetical protein